MCRLITLALLAALCSTSLAAKVLVLQDDPLIRSTHSTYFRELHSQGHTVTIKSVTDSSLKLRDWDDWIYDKLVIFAPSATGRTACPCYLHLSDLIDNMHRTPSMYFRVLEEDHHMIRLAVSQTWGAT